MRPIKLIMRAFGPYANTVEIDFTQLGESGIYLVTGDTGAGKTTIFDAISFALFGHASGADRSTRSLRSDFADPASDTNVELEFSYRGETYRIWRSPGYERAKKRGEGTTFQAPDAQLDRPGKAPITRVRDVDAAIEEILGIDRNQFAQIVMIAQGDFRKLLSAGTDERIKIFRKLFDTEAYLAFQKNLADKKRELEASHDDIEKALLLHAKTARFDEGSAERFELEQRLASKTLQASWMKDALSKTIQRNQESAQAASGQLERAREARDAALKAEHEFQQAFQTKQQLDQELARQTQLIAHVNQAQAALETAAAHQPERDALAQQAAVAEQDLPLYEELDKELAALNALGNDKKQAESDMEVLSDGIRQYRAEQNHAEQTATRLADAGTRHAKACVASSEADTRFKNVSSHKEAWLAMLSSAEEARKAKLEAEQAEASAKAAEEQHEATKQAIIDATARRDALLHAPEHLARCESAKTATVETLQHVEHEIKAYREAEGECTAARAAADTALKGYLEAKAASDNAHAEWMHANTAYLNGQAGLLAADLNDGCPCPVCGSTTHPNLAVIPASTPTKQDVEQLQKRWLALSERTSSSADASSKAQAAFVEKERQLARLTESDGSIEQLEEKLELAKTARADAEQAWNKACNAAFALDQAQDSLQKAQAKRERADHSARTSMEQASKARAKAERLCATTQAQRVAIPYQDEAALTAEYEEAHGALTKARVNQKEAEQSVKELDQARRSLKHLTEKIEQAQQKLNDASARKATAQAQMEAKSASVCSMRAKLAYGTKAEAEQSLSAMHNRIATIDKAVKSAQTLLDDRKADLSSVAGSIETMRTSLERMPQHNAEDIAEKKRAASDAYNLANETLSTIRTKLSANETAFREVTALSEKAGAIDALFGEIAALSDTANGKLAGKDKIAFETYVQGIYFDRMTEAANKRFIAMTNGRYELRRRRIATSKTGQSGLDLDVLDNYTGKSRDASSLSGGESFKASLALALGLSDVVQAYAGGIQLDTMFIDEGFGSLDQESLQLAIKTLTELSGGDKLIGIISHVDELKESIDKKIVVTRGRNGSSLTIEG